MLYITSKSKAASLHLLHKNYKIKKVKQVQKQALNYAKKTALDEANTACFTV